MKTFKQLFEETLEEKKALDSVKKGQTNKLSDDDLMDVADELGRKTWNKDNKDAVMSWIKSVEKEMKKRGISGGKISPVFEGSALDRYKASKAKGDKSSFECMECGKKFKKKIGKGEVKCPSCKSTDVEVD